MYKLITKEDVKPNMFITLPLQHAPYVSKLAVLSITNNKVYYMYTSGRCELLSDNFDSFVKSLNKMGVIL